MRKKVVLKQEKMTVTEALLPIIGGAGTYLMLFWALV
jgi:hypothetical protein